MRAHYIIAAISVLALGAAGASAGQLPQYEVTGFPISLLKSSGTQEQPSVPTVAPQLTQVQPSVPKAPQSCEAKCLQRCSDSASGGGTTQIACMSKCESRGRCLD
jgi:hypothetical protein